MPKAVVYQQHTLGFLTPSGIINVLRSSPLKGGDNHYEDPIRFYNKDQVRPATRKDFDEFRVRYHPSYQVIDDTDQLKI